MGGEICYILKKGKIGEGMDKRIMERLKKCIDILEKANV